MEDILAKLFVFCLMLMFIAWFYIMYMILTVTKKEKIIYCCYILRCVTFRVLFGIFVTPFNCTHFCIIQDSSLEKG